MEASPPALAASSTRTPHDAEHRQGLRVSAAVALVVIAISLFWLASAQHYRSCIEKAEAQFPAVAVSALTGRATGPLKVSFVRERAAAVADCGHFF